MGEEKAERIFLYGTLRRGASRDVREFYSGVEFVAAGRVRGRIFDFGEYPGFRADSADAWVTGEVFDVTPAALVLLDDWEGIPPGKTVGDRYQRIGAEVELSDGGREACWIYEVSGDYSAGRPIIESGDWLAR